MIRNEKGFIFPLTYIILMFFFTFISIQLELYVSEKKFIKETEESLEKEYYFKLAVKELQVLLAKESTSEKSGTIFFRNGKVNYSIEPYPNEILCISIQLSRDGKLNVYGFAYFDQVQKKMVKWQEKG